jgi:hypothetical protein
MSTCTNRKVLTDSINGQLFDLGNPNLVIVEPDTSTPPLAILHYTFSTFHPPGITFADASAAFNAS